MNDYDTSEDYYLAIQAQINSLEAWKFEGSVGRAMMDAIKSGRCCLGFDRTADYWGNTIPGRDDVQDGTVGSVGYVTRAMGEDWAEMVAAVPYKSALEVFA